MPRRSPSAETLVHGRTPSRGGASSRRGRRGRPRGWARRGAFLGDAGGEHGARGGATPHHASTRASTTRHTPRWMPPMPEKRSTVRKARGAGAAAPTSTGREPGAPEGWGWGGEAPWAAAGCPLLRGPSSAGSEGSRSRTEGGRAPVRHPREGRRSGRGWHPGVRAPGSARPGPPPAAVARPPRKDRRWEVGGARSEARGPAW